MHLVLTADVLNFFVDEDAYRSRQEPLQSIAVEIMQSVEPYGDGFMICLDDSERVALDELIHGDAKRWMQELQSLGAEFRDLLDTSAVELHGGDDEPSEHTEEEDPQELQCASGFLPAIEDGDIEEEVTVTIQIDVLMGAAVEDSEAEDPQLHEYLVSAHMPRSKFCDLQTEMRLGQMVEDSSGGWREDCAIKQQMRFIGPASAEEIFLSIFRRPCQDSVEFAEHMESIGECTLLVQSPEHYEVRLHQIVDDIGPTGAVIKLRLKRPDGSSPGRAREASEGSLHCQDAKPTPSRGPRTAWPQNGTAKPVRHGNAWRGAGGGGKSFLPLGVLSDASKLAGQSRDRPPSPNGSDITACSTLRGHHLYALHAEKMRQLDARKRRVLMEDQAKLEAEILRVRRYSPEELDGHHCARRLWQDSDTRQQRQRRRDIEQQREEEQGKLRRPKIAATSSTPNLRNVYKRQQKIEDTVNSLFEDAQRRKKNQEKKREEKLREEDEEQKRLQRKPETSSPTAGDTKREKLYEEAAAKRKKMEDKRKEKEEQEMKEMKDKNVSRNHKPMTNERMVELHELHKKHIAWCIDRRKSTETKATEPPQHQANKQSPRRAVSPKRKEKVHVSVEFTLKNVEANRLLSSAKADLRSKCERAVAEAVKEQLDEGMAVETKVNRHPRAAHRTRRVNSPDDKKKGTFGPGRAPSLAPVTEVWVLATVTAESTDSAQSTQERLKLWADNSGASKLKEVLAGVSGITSMTRYNSQLQVTDLKVGEPDQAMPLYRPYMRLGTEIFRDLPEPAATKEERQKGAHEVELLVAAVVGALKARLPYHIPEGELSRARWLRDPVAKVLASYRGAANESEKRDGHFLDLQSLQHHRIWQGQLRFFSRGMSLSTPPDPIRQVESDLNSLLLAAAEAQSALLNLLAGDEPPPGGRPNAYHGHQGPLKLSASDTKLRVPGADMLYTEGVKSRADAELQADVLYGPSAGRQKYQHLLDLASATLVFPSCDSLLSGLEFLIEWEEHLEVYCIHNYHHSPFRCGMQCVHVLAVVVSRQKVGHPVADLLLHVCELRLITQTFWDAQVSAADPLQALERVVKQHFADYPFSGDAAAFIVRKALHEPPEPRALKHLRNLVGRQYGSGVSAFRRLRGGGRGANTPCTAGAGAGMGANTAVGFQKFRDACLKMGCTQTQAHEAWLALDRNLVGRVTLIDMDAAAVSLLLRVRAVLVAAANDRPFRVGAPLIDLVFHRLAGGARQRDEDGKLTASEWKQTAQRLGLDPDVASRVFTHLDFHGGRAHPASVTQTDILFLLEDIGQCVDEDSLFMVKRPVLLQDVAKGIATPHTRGTKSAETDEHVWQRAAYAPEPRAPPPTAEATASADSATGSRKPSAQQQAAAAGAAAVSTGDDAEEEDGAGQATAAASADSATGSRKPSAQQQVSEAQGADGAGGRLASMSAAVTSTAAAAAAVAGAAAVSTGDDAEEEDGAGQATAAADAEEAGDGRQEEQVEGDDQHEQEEAGEGEAEQAEEAEEDGEEGEDEEAAGEAEEEQDAEEEQEPGEDAGGGAGLDDDDDAF